MKPGNDSELRSDFQRLRDETERAGAPSFRDMMARANADAAQLPRLEVSTSSADGSRERRRTLWVAGGWASMATAATVAALVLAGGDPDPEAEFERLVEAYSADVRSGALSSPTSALLRVPGMSLTRSVPSVGWDDARLPDGRDSAEGRDS